MILRYTWARTSEGFAKHHQQFSDTYLSVKMVKNVEETCGIRILRKIDAACLVRSAIVAIFLTGAALCGVYIHFYFLDMEQKVADDRYNLSADRGLALLEHYLRLRMKGMVVLSKMASYSHNIESAWPEAVVPGFFDTVGEIHDMTYLDNICFMPLVHPEELPVFETFMYKYFDTEPEIPSRAGIHPFGKGVFAQRPSNLSNIYHDTTGVTLRYSSPNTFLTPILQMLSTVTTEESELTFNVHSSPRVGPYMDNINDVCLPALNRSADPRQCGLVTNSYPSDLDVALYNYTGHDYRALILQPVILGQNKRELIGFTSGEISWHRTLAQSFYAYVGLDVVIVNGATVFTYSVNRIEYTADFVGTGDLHDPKYSHYQAELVVSAELLGLNDAPPYRVYVYPNDIFFRDAHSNTSVIIGAAVAVTISLTTIIFAAYDVFMRRETRRKAEMLTIKRKFVRFISHEIRTPLNSVHLGLELLVEELKHIACQINAAPSISVSLLVRMREALADWLELSADLVGNSESAVDVLNDLLNYDKIEMGTLRLDFTAVPIWILVEKTTCSFKMQAKQKNIALEVTNGILDMPNTNDVRTLVVIGDSARIAQVLRNLLSNALKFTPTEGTVTVTVEWRAYGLPEVEPLNVPREKADLLKLPRAGSVCIHVEDTGVGLSPEQLAHIGAEGIQFDANRLQAGQGSGLGLYISKGLVEQHHGKLTVSSEGPGKGSKFSVELPLYRRAERDAPQQPNGGRCHAVSQNGERKVDGADELGTPDTHTVRYARRVLVVDDAVSNRKMLMRLLKTRGFQCEQAEDGQQAVDLYRALQGREETVDIVVMDFEMPVMNGPTATRKLRELGCTCKIVGVTGNLLPEDVDYFTAQGANAVLGKPLNIKAFEEIINNDQRRLEEEGEDKRVPNNNRTSSDLERSAGIEMV